MKNKILFLGTICLILALGLVITGCKNEVQSIELGSVSAPKNVTAAWVAAVTTGPVANHKDAHILVKWDAVADAGGYGIVYTLDGKKNYQWLDSGSDGITKVTYTPPAGSADGDGKYTYTYNATLDIDKAEAEIFKPSWAGGGKNQLIKFYGGLDLKIGVISYSRNSDGKYQSKPAWAKDLVSIPNTYKE